MHYNFLYMSPECLLLVNSCAPLQDIYKQVSFWPHRSTAAGARHGARQSLLQSTPAADATASSLDLGPLSVHIERQRVNT